MAKIDKINVNSTTYDIGADASNVEYMYGGSLSPIQQATDVQEALDGLDDLVNGLDTNKQDTLVSGTNIKTVNGNSLLGSGNITISSVTVLYGTTDPTSSQGSDGDIYIKYEAK